MNVLVLLLLAALVVVGGSVIFRGSFAAGGLTGVVLGAVGIALIWMVLARLRRGGRGG